MFDLNDVLMRTIKTQIKSVETNDDNSVTVMELTLGGDLSNPALRNKLCAYFPELLDAISENDESGIARTSSVSPYEKNKELTIHSQLDSLESVGAIVQKAMYKLTAKKEQTVEIKLEILFEGSLDLLRCLWAPFSVTLNHHEPVEPQGAFSFSAKDQPRN